MEPCRGGDRPPCTLQAKSWGPGKAGIGWIWSEWHTAQGKALGIRGLPSLGYSMTQRSEAWQSPRSRGEDEGSAKTQGQEEEAKED